MKATKKISEWEKERNLMFRDLAGIDLEDEVTQEVFDQLTDDNQATVVIHEDRKLFLEKNGYELTRENFLDHTLSTKQPAKKSKK